MAKKFVVAVGGDRTLSSTRELNEESAKDMDKPRDSVALQQSEGEGDAFPVDFQKTEDESEEKKREARMKREEAKDLDEMQQLLAEFSAGKLDRESLEIRVQFLMRKVAEHEKILNFHSPASSTQEQLRTEGREALIPPPMSPDDVVFEHFNDVLDLADERMNILLYGPTGSGKSHIARQVAQKLRLPFYTQSCSEGMNESVFMGMKLPGDGGKWVYEPSRFVDFFANGGVFCLDEMDAADANLLVYPNSAISNGWLSLELDGGRMVKRHPNFILIGTANSAGHGGDSSYLRNELDIATLRRFKTGMIHIPYSPVVEEKLVDAQVLAWGRAMRKAIDKLMLDRSPVSTGLLIEYSRMKEKKNWSPKRWTQSFFEGLNEDQQTSLRKEFKVEVEKAQAELVERARKAGLEAVGMENT